MQWHPVDDGPDERTEVSEIPDRGCLVRIVVRSGADGRWSTSSVCWCPGLTRADFGATVTAAAAPATTAEPAPAETPTPTATPTPAPTPTPTPTPAPAPAAAPAEDFLTVLREYTAMRSAVVGAFRGKIGVSSGAIGFLDNLPQVGSFSVPGQGDWIWRVDPTVATLRSKARSIELPLPDHARDDGFDGEAVAGYLKATNRQAVALEGANHGVDAATVTQLIRKLEAANRVRLFSQHPKPVYIVK